MSGLLPPNKAEQALINAARKGEEIDLTSFSTDGNGKTLISAEFLRTLILQKNGWEVHERGIRLRNAHIHDQLDLSNCRIDFPLIFWDCIFGSKEKWINFINKHYKDPKAKDIPECAEDISALNFDRARLHSITVEKGIFYGGIWGERSEIRYGLFINRSKVHGPTWLSGIHVDGQITLNRSKLYYKVGHSLDLQNAFVRDAIFLKRVKILGKCHLSGAKIMSQLVANDAIFKYKSDICINAQEAKISTGAFFRKTTFHGSIRLHSATLGHLFMEGAKLKSSHKREALNASNCIITGDCRLNNDFTVHGAVIFDQAEVKGELSLSKARLFSQFAKAEIYAKSTAAAQDAGELDQIHIHKHPFGGMLQGRMDSHSQDGKKDNDIMIAFSFVEGRAGRLAMPEKEPPSGIVNLARARIGTLEDFREGWPRQEGADEEHLVLDGFIYDHLSNPGGCGEGDGAATAKDIANARKQWLLRQKPEHLNEHFRSQPWRQLIRVLRRDGMDDAARRLEVRYLRRMRQTQIDFWSMSRLAGWFIDLISRYGRKPWRALRFGIAVIVAFACMWSFAMLGCAQEGCRDESVFVRTKVAEYSRKPIKSDEKKGTYPDFNPFGFSFDVFIPLFNFGYQDTWAVNTGWKPLLGPIPIRNPECLTDLKRYFYRQQYCSSPESIWWNFTISGGGLLYLAYLLEIFLGGILVAIAIAGFTGLIGRRREEE